MSRKVSEGRRQEGRNGSEERDVQILNEGMISAGDFDENASLSLFPLSFFSFSFFVHESYT